MKTREEKFARILAIANVLGKYSFESSRPSVEHHYRTKFISNPAKTLGLIHKDLMQYSPKWDKRDWDLFEILGKEIAELDFEEFTNEDLNEMFHLYLSKANAEYYIMSASEAEEKWGLKPGTVRASCTRGKLKDHKGVRKSGNTWLVTVSAMNEVYGKGNKHEINVGFEPIDD